jgi:hypothetical protein
MVESQNPAVPALWRHHIKILAEIGHGGEPKDRYGYPPWQIFDNTGFKSCIIKITKIKSPIT